MISLGRVCSRVARRPRASANSGGSLTCVTFAGLAPKAGLPRGRRVPWSYPRSAALANRSITSSVISTPPDVHSVSTYSSPRRQITLVPRLHLHRVNGHVPPIVEVENDDFEQ